MNQRNAAKTHEIVTWANRSWPLTEYEYKSMNERLEAGAKFLTIPDGSDSKVSTSDIKFFGRRQVSIADLHDEMKALPAGEPKKFDPLARGYIKFLAMSIKLRKKHGGSLQAILDKINDEQRPLINEELKKAGVDFQV